MSTQPELRRPRDLQVVTTQITELLQKCDVVSSLANREPTDSPHHDLVASLTERQNLSILRRRIGTLHPADLADVLESLPPRQRLRIWELVDTAQRGAVLIETAPGVREDLLRAMGGAEIVGATEHLESDEIADIVPDLPKDTAMQLLTALNQDERTEVQSVLQFPEDTVGSLMELDVVTLREDVALKVVLRYLRGHKDLPDHIDPLWVVNRDGVLQGSLTLKALVTHKRTALVSTAMSRNPVVLHTDDEIREAVNTFERYDLNSAPVVNKHNQLVGAVRVDKVLEYANEMAQQELLSQVGLSEHEDLFDPVWESSRRRWTWLGINLVTAFVASRVIGAFEATIEQLVALAALMPIVASIAGNTGNQTLALIIRGLALDQVNPGNLRYLLSKELAISVINGALWGTAVGLFAFLFYRDGSLSLLMSAAVLLNLLIAALAGVMIPAVLDRMGRDPVMGGSVILTALTDSLGFFIVLGLATIFLL